MIGGVGILPQRETRKDMRRADVKRIIRKRLYHQIRADLLDQLERNGTLGKYYIDLVDDYMDLWVTKCLLVEDIQERGVTVEYNNGGGQAGKKKNDSIEAKNKGKRPNA